MQKDFDSWNVEKKKIDIVQVIDVKRLNHRIGRISIVDFQELTKKLKELIP